MNNNHLVFQNDMGRQFMSLEHKLDAKLLAHGEAIAEIIVFKASPRRRD